MTGLFMPISVHAQTSDLLGQAGINMDMSMMQQGYTPEQELSALMRNQELGSPWLNPVKYTIRAAVLSGVPINTIVLLLLLPVIAAFIAAARHLVGLRGFGIFLPAALAVVFVETGPLVGIAIFLVVVGASMLIRLILKKTKVRMQYLPKMALMLLFVVFAVLCMLFLTPLLNQPSLATTSILPILIMVLLAEHFIKVQSGKSARVAVNITSETLILALVSFIILTLRPLQEYALLHPEMLLILVVVFDFVIGKYVGLRFVEYWRFRKLITG